MVASVAKFGVRELPCGGGFVVDKRFPCGATEQLIGVYISEEYARTASLRYRMDDVEPVAVAEVSI